MATDRQPVLTFFAAAPRHLGDLLAAELRGLGIADATELRGGARFAGTLEDAIRASLWSRVANRILLPLAAYPALTPDDLHAATLDLPWEDHLLPERTFAVQVDGRLGAAGDSRFAALRVKDGIADRLRARWGRRPDVDPRDPELPIHVHVRHDQATFSLDLSGASLHRRGYRTAGSAAPLKENLAAALLLRAGWPALAADGGALLDPMCGSGTLIVEGTLIAADIAPGLGRARFGFQAWRQYEPAVWERLHAEALARRDAGLRRLRQSGLALFHGYDRDPRAVAVAQQDLARAGLTGLASFAVRELADCRPARDGAPGLLTVNPPYGERLGAEHDLTALYARLGQLLRERFPGWHAAVLTARPELGQALGLRAHRKHAVYNGPIACELLHFAVPAVPAPAPPVMPAPARPAVPHSAGMTMFANRLAKNLRALRGWRRAQGIDCYRLYDADLPEYALAIDVYRGADCWAQVQEYAPPPSIDPERAQRRLDEALAATAGVLGIPAEQVFLKIRRPQRGASQYERLASTGRFHEVREGDCRFWVNFTDYLDTGLFLDHRDTRRLIGRLAPGTRFLNLFGYTGTASVHAARGGARSTATVDLSRTYLEWAARNLELNGIGGAAHELIQADCRDWLDRQAGARRFDLIFLDPPSFSNSRRMRDTLDIQRDHAALIAAAARVLDPAGILIFSTNLRQFRLDREALPGLAVEDLGARTRPRDFSRNPRIHQCWMIASRN